MKQTPENDTCNPHLLNVIPCGVKSIIEIGCMTGALAREYKKINPNCFYHGVDIVPEYINKAEKWCDSVSSFDFDDSSIEFYKTHSDKECWIFGDVLEHLKDPWSVLKNIRQVIPNNGYVISSIPNAACFTMYVNLALGKFDYYEKGIFDKTHLRWFTQNSIIEMFQIAGFEVEHLASISFGETVDRYIEEQVPILHVIGELANLSGGSSNAAISAAKVCQYLVRAIPRSY